MQAIQSLNLGLAFVLELRLLAAFGYFGFHLDTRVTVAKVVVGIGLPLLIAVTWGMFLAPQATWRLEIPWLLALKVILFSLGVLTLYANGKLVWAAMLGIITIIHFTLAIIWKQV